jgi:2,4-dienoyl-CoA reductase-like NADH-dependent reductase (Old Yellow Enzyme family)
LFDSFWTPAINQRSDKYGGSLDNRMRFSLAALEAIRKEIGDEFI